MRAFTSGVTRGVQIRHLINRPSRRKLYEEETDNGNTNQGWNQMHQAAKKVESCHNTLILRTPLLKYGEGSKSDR